MRFHPLPLVGACVLFATSAAAQCVQPPHPLFEFQTERAAAYIGDSTMVPRPVTTRVADAHAYPEVLVQFVVDTLGVPDPATLHTLRTSSRAAADSVRQVLTAWRFSPALESGCKVPQIVQTEVVH